MSTVSANVSWAVSLSSFISGDCCTRCRFSITETLAVNVSDMEVV